jgi:hypothetical protein
MKKIDTQYILANTGMPIKSGSIDHIFNALSDTCVATYKSLNNNYDPTRPNVMYGVVDTSAGSVCTIGAGAVIWNEELFFIPATSFSFTNIPIAVISTSYVLGANADPVLMTDGVSRNVHAIRTIEIIDGSNSTPNYVADLTDFVYGDGKSLLEEHTYTATISTTSPTNTTLHTQTMAVAGQVWFLFDNQVTPASGGAGTNYILNFEILKNGGSQVTKILSVSNDGARRDFTFQKVIDVEVGDTIVFRANSSINASVPVVGRLVIQANKVSV